MRLFISVRTSESAGWGLASSQMASFSSGFSSGGSRQCAGADAGGGGEGARLFVGSFNLNSEDLTVKAAKAWLKQAGDADIVALGLQVKTRFTGILRALGSHDSSVCT